MPSLSDSEIYKLINHRLQNKKWARALSDLNVSIPLTAIENELFQGMSEDHAAGWTQRFVDAIACNTSTAFIIPSFAKWMLRESLHEYLQTEEQRAWFNATSELYETAANFDACNYVASKLLKVAEHAAIEAQAAFDSHLTFVTGAEDSEAELYLDSQRTSWSKQSESHAVHAGYNLAAANTQLAYLRDFRNDYPDSSRVILDANQAASSSLSEAVRLAAWASCPQLEHPAPLAFDRLAEKFLELITEQ